MTTSHFAFRRSGIAGAISRGLTTRSLQWRHAQTLADGIRVEIEDPTNGFEGIRPVCFVGDEPPLRRAEELAALGARGGTIFLEAFERVAKDGNHQPLFGDLLAPRSEVLRRQQDAELRCIIGGARVLKSDCRSHTPLVLDRRRLRKLGVLRAYFYAGGVACSGPPSSASRWKRCSTWWITGANITPASTRNTTPASKA